MEWQQKIFSQISKLYLKLRIGIENNNLGFDYLLMKLIKELETQIQTLVPDTFDFHETNLKLIFKTWISNYGILKRYGYLFVLIGYLGNDFSHLNNHLNLSNFENEILNNCALNLNIQQILNDQFLIADSQVLKDSYQYLKQAMDNSYNKQIIVETLVDTILKPDTIFVQELKTFKKAHNRYCQIKQWNDKQILDDSNSLAEISLILDTLLNTLDDMSIFDKDFYFGTSLNPDTILDIKDLLINSSNKYPLVQNHPDFDKWNDDIDFKSGMLIPFDSTSLAVYLKHLLGFNLLYEYTHLNCLNQNSIVNYLETVIHLIPLLYQQVCITQNIVFEGKVFSQLTYSLKTILKQNYASIIHDLMTYYQLNLTLELDNQPIPFNSQELINKLRKIEK